MSPEPTSLEHQDPPWLWAMLSVGSIALHLGLLLLLGGRGLTLQATAPSRSGNWVPITLWSAPSDANAAANPAATPIAPLTTSPSPVPVAPQTSPNPEPSPPQAQPENQLEAAQPKPNPDAQPNTAKPNPNPQNSPQSSPSPTPPQPSPNASPTTGEPEGNTQDDPGQSSSGFGVGLEWPNEICQMGSPVACTDPVDRPAEVQTEPTAVQVASLVQSLSLEITISTQIRTVIIVESDGRATVVLTASDGVKTTQVLQGNLTVTQAETLAQKMLALYRFSPTLREGQATPYGYTITLTVTPDT